MYKNKKWAALLTILCLMSFLFAGCAASFDASKFVKNSLDSVYLGTWDGEYPGLVNSAESEIKAKYESRLEARASLFISYFNIDDSNLSDSMRSEIVELCREIFSHSKFEPGEAEKTDNAYVVGVTVYPLDIIRKVADNDVPAFIERWDSRYKSDEFDSLSAAEVEETWAREIIDMVRARLPNIGYLESETVSVQVVVEKFEKEKYYAISEDDLERIDSIMIKY